MTIEPVQKLRATPSISFDRALIGPSPVSLLCGSFERVSHTLHEPVLDIVELLFREPVVLSEPCCGTVQLASSDANARDTLLNTPSEVCGIWLYSGKKTDTSIEFL